MDVQSAAALLAWRLVGLYDRGEAVGVDAVERRTAEGTLFGWLGAEYDLQLGPEAEQVLAPRLRRLCEDTDPRRQFGVAHNGLALLLAWSLALQQPNDDAP